MYLTSLMPTIAKVISALMPGDQCHTVVLNGEPLEDVEKFKYLGSMLVANGQGTEETRSRINPAHSAFSHPQTCLSRREISMRSKGRVYQVVMRSILLVEGLLAVFDNERIRRILPSQCVYRRLCWFTQAARRPEGELINTASHVAKANWRPTENMGDETQG